MVPLVRRAGVPAPHGAALQGPVRICESQPRSVRAVPRAGQIYALWREGAATRMSGELRRGSLLHQVPAAGGEGLSAASREWGTGVSRGGGCLPTQAPVPLQPTGVSSPAQTVLITAQETLVYNLNRNWSLPDIFSSNFLPFFLLLTLFLELFFLFPPRRGLN